MPSIMLPNQAPCEQVLCRLYFRHSSSVLRRHRASADTTCHTGTRSFADRSPKPSSHSRQSHSSSSTAAEADRRRCHATGLGAAGSWRAVGLCWIPYTPATRSRIGMGPRLRPTASFLVRRRHSYSRCRLNYSG